jgi:hypothetical protein
MRNFRYFSAWTTSVRNGNALWDGNSWIPLTQSEPGKTSRYRFACNVVDYAGWATVPAGLPRKLLT